MLKSNVNKKAQKLKIGIEAPFEPLKKKFLDEKGIGEKRMFGTTVLTVRGKVFAFPWKGNLVLKLPHNKVLEIISSKKGTYFDPGHGRTSKEWIEVGSGAKSEWVKLTKQAKKFADTNFRRKKLVARAKSKL